MKIKVFKQVQQLTLIVAITLCFAVATELIVAIVSPSPFVTHDILGRPNSGPDFYQIDQDDFQTYDLQPRQKLTQSLLSDYKTDVVINSYSLRNKDIDDIDPRSFRILILGDSQTFGLGVGQDETFAAQTENMLRESGNDVVVLNGGVHGYGTYDILWKLERLSKVMDFDLVIVVCFLDNWLVSDEGNDLWKNYQILQWANSGDFSEHQPDSQFMLEHFHTYLMLSYIKRKITGAPTYFERVQAYRAETHGGQDLQRVWNETRRLLQDIARQASESKNARMLVLHLPSITALELSDRSTVVELEKTGLPVLSVYDALKKAGDESGYEWLHFRHDSHYNARAHKIIAKVLADYLSRTEMIGNRNSSER